MARINVVGEFKVGDVVRLNSDGPNMTIDWIDDGCLVGCVWFSNHCLYKDTFMYTSLKLVEN